MVPEVIDAALTAAEAEGPVENPAQDSPAPAELVSAEVIDPVDDAPQTEQQTSTTSLDEGADTKVVDEPASEELVSAEADGDQTETSPEPAPEPAGAEMGGISQPDPLTPDIQPEIAAELEATETPTAEEVEPAEDAQPDPVLSKPAAAYAVDDSVLAILREEAEREASARKSDGGPLEVQTDLGLAAAASVASKVVEVIGRESEPASVQGDREHGESTPSRRAQFPDIEEINSTLRPEEHPTDGSGDARGDGFAAEGRSGFRTGFLTVMAVAILAAALYISASTVAEVVPALAGPLEAYVAFIDSLRLKLDGLMRIATAAINGEAG